MVHKRKSKREDEIIDQIDKLKDQREYFRTKLDDIDGTIIDLETEFEEITGSMLVH